MTLVFLHGPPATGKYTVGRELAALTGFELYHNHLVVDAVLQQHAFGTPGFVTERDRRWRAHLGHLARDTIFTFNPENSVPQAFINWLFATVPGDGGRLVSVGLTASEAVIESRLATAQRRQFKKLTELELYRRLRAAGAFALPLIPRTDLVLDTAQLTPVEAARQIAGRLAR